MMNSIRISPLPVSGQILDETEAEFRPLTLDESSSFGLASDSTEFVKRAFARYGLGSTEYVRLTTKEDSPRVFQGHFQGSMDAEGSITSFDRSLPEGVSSIRELPFHEQLPIDRVQALVTFHGFGCELRSAWITLFDSTYDELGGSGKERLRACAGSVAEVKAHVSDDPSESMTLRGRIVPEKNGNIQLVDPLRRVSVAPTVRDCHIVTSIELLQLPTFWDRAIAAGFLGRGNGEELLPHLFERGAAVTITSKPIDVASSWRVEPPQVYDVSGKFLEVALDNLGERSVLLKTERGICAFPVRQIESMHTEGVTREGYVAILEAAKLLQSDRDSEVRSRRLTFESVVVQSITGLSD
ncbi:MAG: hypothetical protein KDD70_00150 [Bdellovibrionales bacterium]|nr:hypothetical protein [Bdellovibrionales bacterium]